MGFQEQRKKAGLTQQEAADKLGVNRVSISRWETDACDPTLHNVRQMAELYGCSVGDLFAN